MISVDSKGDGADGVVVGGVTVSVSVYTPSSRPDSVNRALLDVSIFHRNDISVPSPGFWSGELCLPRLTVLIDLVHDHLVGKDDDVIPGGCARAITAQVVGVLSFCLVDVALCAQNSAIVQLRLEVTVMVESAVTPETFFRSSIRSQRCIQVSDVVPSFLVRTL